MLKAIGWIVVVLLLAFGALVGVNAIDEDLSPQSLKLLEKAANPFKDEDNAYFAIWGMTAAEGRDTHATGRQAVAAITQRASGSAAAVPADAYSKELGKLKASPEVGELCDWVKQDCYPKLSAASDQAEALAAANKVLLERYAALGGYKGYYDTAPPGFATPFPPFQEVSGMATLDLLLAVAEAKRGDVAAAATRISSASSTARSVLGSPTPLVAKMVFANVLHRHAVVLAGVSAEHAEFAAVGREALAKALAPLSAAERSIAPSLGYEFAATHRLFRDTAAEADPWHLFGEPASLPLWVMRRFIQPNATTNLVAGLASEKQRLAVLQADAFVAQRAAFRQQETAYKSSLEGFALRNLIGRQLAGLTGTDELEYALRLHDLDAHLRLVALALDIRARRLEPDAIAALVAAATPPAVDPYSGKPFLWDAGKRELSTPAQAKNQRYARGGRFVAKL
jgi:hypothetical protein